MNHFKGKQFQKDVIIISVGYYLRYNLSYRDVQEMLYDRGINVSHTTIYRWVQEYGKLIYQIWKKKNRQSFYSWKMDETYIKIKGKWHYLYRAIDSEGMTLDIWLRRKRNTQSAYAFFKRLYKQFGEPKVIVTDKAPSIASAFRKLQKQGLYSETEHRTVKYLNNLIEQDHRPVKRRNKLYQSLRTASTTIKGIEALRGIYKKNRRNGTLFGFSVSTEIKVLMGIPAQSKYQNGTFVLSIETLQQNPTLKVKEDASALVCFASDVGIAAIRPIITEWAGKRELILSHLDKGVMAFDSELVELAANQELLTYETSAGFSQSKEQLAQAIDYYGPKANYLLAGQSDDVEAMKAFLSSKGIDSSRIQVEMFRGLP